MVYAVAAVLLLVGVALFVSAPLYGHSGRPSFAPADASRERLEHERAQAVHALRELELDRRMNKLSRADYEQLRAPLEARALGALAALERFKAPAVERTWSLGESRTPESWPADGDDLTVDAAPQTESPRAPAPAPAPVLLLPESEEARPAPSTSRLARKPPAPPDAPVLKAAFCPACGAGLNAWAKFCSTCGTRLSAAR